MWGWLSDYFVKSPEQVCTYASDLVDVVSLTNASLPCIAENCTNQVQEVVFNSIGSLVKSYAEMAVPTVEPYMFDAAYVAAGTAFTFMTTYYVAKYASEKHMVSVLGDGSLYRLKAPIESCVSLHSTIRHTREDALIVASQSKHNPNGYEFSPFNMEVCSYLADQVGGLCANIYSNGLQKACHSFPFHLTRPLVPKVLNATHTQSNQHKMKEISGKEIYISSLIEEFSKSLLVYSSANFVFDQLSNVENAYGLTIPTCILGAGRTTLIGLLYTVANLEPTINREQIMKDIVNGALRSCFFPMTITFASDYLIDGDNQTSSLALAVGGIAGEALTYQFSKMMLPLGKLINQGNEKKDTNLNLNSKYSAYRKGV